MILYPSLITNPSLVFMGDYARISSNNVILNNKGCFVMGKYSLASTGLNVVPDGHTSTVGIPIRLLGDSHIHDKVEDVIVDEDVWIGMNVTLLGGAHIGRGCVIGANSLVLKGTVAPPYAVLVGTPARIIAVTFSIEQILQHEEKLYPEEERMTREELEELFEKHYKDKRVFGVDTPLNDDERQDLSNTMRALRFPEELCKSRTYM